MFIEKTNGRGKYTCYLLRENYREGGRIKHRTLANLSVCRPAEIAAMRLALKHKKDLTQLVSVAEAVSLRQGLSGGAVWLIFDMARQLGIAEALGNSRPGKLALWQVIARVIDQGWRLSAGRLAGRTRGHVLVVMPAYRIVRELARRCNQINLTVEEDIHELTTLCAIEMLVESQPRCHKIPQPRPLVKELLQAAAVRLPDILPCQGIRAARRKKLPDNRITT